MGPPDATPLAGYMEGARTLTEVTPATEPRSCRRHRTPIIRRKTDKSSALSTIMSISSILSLNCFGSVVIVSLFIVYFNIYEMRITGSFEIVYTVLVLIAATIIKISQCALCFKMRRKQFSLFMINYLLYFPIILLLWQGLNCTASYQDSVKSLQGSRMSSLHKIKADFFANDKFQKKASGSIEELMENPVMHIAWNAVQKKHSCCGMHSYKEYSLKKGRIPITCCMQTIYIISNNDNCIPHQRGCLPIIQLQLYDLNTQLHSIMLMFLLPVEMIVSFLLLLTYLVIILRKYTVNDHNTPNNSVTSQLCHQQQNATSGTVANNGDDDPSNLRISNINRNQTVFDPPPSYHHVVAHVTDV